MNSIHEGREDRRIKEIKDLHFGHKQLVLEDGSLVTIVRGKKVPKVGEEWPKS